MRRIAPQKSNESLSRNGFTLVELLVVITIMLLLLSMTVYAVNFSRDSDRVGGGARQIQSALAGARDRAIYAKALTRDGRAAADLVRDRFAARHITF